MTEHPLQLALSICRRECPFLVPVDDPMAICKDEMVACFGPPMLSDAPASTYCRVDLSGRWFSYFEFKTALTVYRFRDYRDATIFTLRFK